MKKILVLCVGLMFLLALGCGGGSKTYSGDSPESAVSSYYQALKDKKPDMAYQFLKNPQKSKDQFVQEKKSGGMSFKEFTVGKAEIKGNTAVVPVKFKTGFAAMPELTMDISVEKGKIWQITDLGMGGKAGHNAAPPAGMPPAGSPPAGSIPQAGGSGSGVAPGSPNPHAPGGSVPLNQ